MLREIGTPCPAYTFGDNKVGDDICFRCDGCKGVFVNGVDCGFSRTPTSEPKFKVGQEIFWLGFPDFYGIVKRIEWDGRFQWHYYCLRERNGHDEQNCFASRRECELARLKRDAKALQRKANSFADRYGLSLEEVNGLLLPDKKD